MSARTRFQKPVAASAVVLLLSVVSSGCLNSSNVSNAQGTEDGQSVHDRLVKDGQAGTGDILGSLTCENGHPVLGAEILLIELNAAVTSDAAGDFEFGNLVPGTYTLRISHELYKPETRSVFVAADKLAVVPVTLTPLVPVDFVGSQPHPHDFWGQRTQLVLFDGSVQWGKSSLHGGDRDPACLLFGDAQGGSPVGANCWAVEFWLDNETAPDEVALVPPGTKELTIEVTWNEPPANPPAATGASLHNVTFEYKPADKAFFTHKFIKNGQAFTLPVSPTMTDRGHQLFSLWQFRFQVRYARVVMADPCCLILWANPTDVMDSAVGPFRVTIVATRGPEIPLEPPHPRFWTNGTQLHLGTLFTNLTALEYPATPNALVCRRNEDACFTLPTNIIVPPGTTRLVVNLTYQVNQSELDPVAKALFKQKKLLFRTAALNPREATLADLRRDGPTQTTWGNTTWSLSLNRDEADAIYQRHSLWLFQLVNEGQEDSKKFSNDCASACKGLQFQLTVDAFNDAWKPEAC